MNDHIRSVHGLDERLKLCARVWERSRQDLVHQIWCHVFKVRWQKRVTLASIRSAVLVQTKGLGSSLVASR